MPDRKKVIKGLGRLSEWLFQQYQIVYDGDAPNYYDAYKTVDDAIDLLKEQEAVPVIQREIMHMLFWCCSSCGVAITDGDKFCRNCGKELKWE